MWECAGEISSKAAKSAADSHIFGIILMVGYLGFDGFTSTWQDRMFKGYQMSVYSQILYVQACSACVSLFSLVAFGQVCLSFLCSLLDCAGHSNVGVAYFETQLAALCRLQV